jgi:hypothetical protein
MFCLNMGTCPYGIGDGVGIWAAGLQGWWGMMPEIIYRN